MRILNKSGVVASSKGLAMGLLMLFMQERLSYAIALSPVITLYWWDALLYGSLFTLFGWVIAFVLRFGIASVSIASIVFVVANVLGFIFYDEKLQYPLMLLTKEIIMVSAVWFGFVLGKKSSPDVTK